MTLNYSKERRDIVRKWSAEVRSLGSYHRDRWEEYLSECDDYETNDLTFTELRQHYLELANHPEYHY